MKLLSFKIRNKLNRYKNIITKLSNWPSFITYKAFNRSQPFTFKLKNSFPVTVPRATLGSFRVIFFDDIYLQNIPPHLLKKPFETVIDIGANAGHFCLYMFSRHPLCRIYAFEPMPFNIRQLEGIKKTHPDFDIQIIPKAVSNSSEGMTIYTDTIDGYTSMAGIITREEKSDQLQVDTVTLGGFIDENHINSIDFLKMDCEGSEYSILYSLPDRYFAIIRIIVIETHKGNNDKENLYSLNTFLENKGFSAKHFDEGFTGYIWAWKN